MAFPLDMFETISAKFKADIQDTIPIPVVYDNEVDPPESGTTYVRFTIKPNNSNQADIGSGSNRHRTFGICFAQIYQTLGAGDKESLEIAGTIEDAFTSVTEDDVTYQTPRTKSIGKVDSNWQTNVEIPFYTDHFK